MTEFCVHPAADAFPMMDDKRLDELVADIHKHGQRVPITLCEGMILDGRNRAKACAKLNIQPRTVVYDGNPWQYVWSLNGTRRDLADLQRAIIKEQIDRASGAWEDAKRRVAEEANRKRSEAAKEQPRSDDGSRLAQVRVPKEHPPAQSVRPTRAAKAEAAHVSPSTQAKAEWIVNKRPDLAEKVAKGEIKGSDALKEIRKTKQVEEEERRAAQAPVIDIAPAIVSDQSVVKCSALITDPPYGILSEDWEPDANNIESITRDWATRWATCGADFIATFFSQRYMWEGRKWFDESFGEHYEFQQLLVWHYANNKSPQSRMGFKQTWEPVFLYRKRGSQKEIKVGAGTWGDGINDFDCHVAAVPQSNFNDVNRKQHPAQKPLSVMVWLVNALTRKGEMVCDPFAGSGTTGVACLQLGRGFHGIETNPEYIELAQRRLAAYGTSL